MILVVTGGRDYGNAFHEAEQIFGVMSAIHAKTPITKLIVGDASGVDLCAWKWAMNNDVPYERVEADWDNVDSPGAVVRYHHNGIAYNVLGGMERNQRMIDEYHPEFYWDFHGGKGTADMIRRCKKAGIPRFQL